MALPSLTAAVPAGIVQWAQSLVQSLEQRFQDLERAKDPVLRRFDKAKLPLANGTRRLIFVNDDAGGAVPAFNDGTNWRRVTDRNVIS